MRFWYLLLLLPSVALAKSETWPRIYNDGVTAYRSNDFSRAATLFESATSSPDRALQQRALYNLGNTSYRLGEAKNAAGAATMAACRQELRKCSRPRSP